MKLTFADRVILRALGVKVLDGGAVWLVPRTRRLRVDQFVYARIRASTHVYYREAGFVLEGPRCTTEVRWAA